MTRAYYSEFDPAAAAWLRELIGAGLIPPGDVDERSITDVSADDIRGYGSVHLFAGIGGWPYALRLAGWPDDRPVWTGSCPCQPFSTAGKRRGNADDRHLWPAMFRLVRECRPVVVFGEQVEGAVRLGWLDGVCADLEGEGYAVGAAVLGAHSAGAPHIRQRLYWVADSDGAGQRPTCGRVREPQERYDIGRGSSTGVLGNTVRSGRQGSGSASKAGLDDCGNQGPAVAASDGGFWSDFDLVPCRDGKTRRVEPGTFPLADGVPGRVGLLRGYGNAIVPQVAAAFVRSYCEARD